MEMCQKPDIQRFIYTCTFAVYGEEIEYLPTTRIRVEQQRVLLVLEEQNVAALMSSAPLLLYL